MRAIYSARFVRELSAAPKPIQGAFDKQLAFLLRHLRHPSLRAKKFDEARDIWQERVTGSWRFLFPTTGNLYQLLTIHSRAK
ncbi:MAG: hypothetical protein ACREQF_11725 [Candidatus Binataceae bacterium]